MDQEPDVIRQEIEQTRSALTDKIETLESEVRSTVLNAKETVEGTLENVKETVQETIENVRDTFEGTVQNMKSSVQETVHSVKETFDLPRQVDRHPWGMLAGSLLAGFVTGRLLEGQRRGYHWGTDHWVSRMGYASAPVPGNRAPERHAPAERPSAPSSSEHGWTDTLYNQFGDEINMVKGMAIGAAMGVVRDLIKQSLPQLAPQIDELMNRTTSKLGGEPIHRPMVEPTARSS
jgi:ElaB/YqjD/DUF883 family membrane-anchored ribosome-binding protein